MDRRHITEPGDVWEDRYRIYVTGGARGDSVLYQAPTYVEILHSVDRSPAIVRPTLIEIVHERVWWRKDGHRIVAVEEIGRIPVARSPLGLPPAR